MKDFGFALNDSNVSDAILRIEITSSDSEYAFNFKSNSENGDEAADNDQSESCTVVKVKTLHISSLILEANSPFFYKLFKNGSKESQQMTVILRINASEEAPLMDLLRFMYNNVLSAQTAPDLLDVLVVADKFEVTSCMTYCSQLLQKLPMSIESAISYLELPSRVSMAEAVQPLADAAKKYLAPLYKLQEEAMALPLSAVKFVLRSDDVQVKSEDDVFNFILKWARAHYPKLEEYREILTQRLAQFIRFPHMSCWKLKEVLISPDFDHEEVSKVVREALFFKAGLPYAESTHLAKDRRFIERVYEYRPIKVVQFQLPHWPRCVVYFDLNKDECANLFPSKRLCSQPFELGGKCLFLKAECNIDHHTSSYHFGLFVYMVGSGQETCTLDYEFEVKKPSEEFESKYKVDSCTLIGGECDGKQNLFEIPWTDFMSDENDDFIDRILHLRAELTLKKSQA